MSNIKTPLEVIQEGERELKTAHADMFKGRVSALYVDKLVTSQTLILLQALHDELEVKKIEQKETETWDTELKTIVYGRRLEIQDQQDNLLALIKKI